MIREALLNVCIESNGDTDPQSNSRSTQYIYPSALAIMGERHLTVITLKRNSNAFAPVGTDIGERAIFSVGQGVNVLLVEVGRRADLALS